MAMVNMMSNLDTKALYGVMAQEKPCSKAFRYFKLFLLGGEPRSRAGSDCCERTQSARAEERSVPCKTSTIGSKKETSGPR
jgi:hypothetical protein